MKQEYGLSIRCYYGPTTFTQHRQRLKLKDIEKWIAAYQFTHPDVVSITVKIWLKDNEGGMENETDK